MHNYQLGMNECLRVFSARRRVSFARRRASTFIARSKSSMTLVNSLSISSTLCGWANPLNVLSAIVSIGQIQKSQLPTETPTFHMVTRTLCDALHHFEHLRDCLLQDFSLFVDDLVCDLVRKERNAFQPIQKVQWHPVILVLFLQELQQLRVTSASERQSGHKPQM